MTRREGLRVDRHGPVALLMLDRPAVKNAFTIAMMDDCATAIRELASDDDVGALVITGAGDAFCSGIELGALASIENHPLSHKRMLTEHVHQVLYALDACEKPVVAAINGAAVGAGLDMALACDLRLAGTTARMSEGYIKVGLVPGDGGCFFLPQLIGLGRALDLLMTGRFVGAEEAEQIGLVTRVVADSELLEEAVALGIKLAGLPPAQLGMIKRSTRSSARQDLRSHLDLMSSHLGVVMASDFVQTMLESARKAT